MAFGYPHMSFIGYPIPVPCAGHAGLGLRTASAADAPAVLDHYQRLSPEDRRMRFCATLGPEALAHHAGRIGAGGSVVLLAIDGPLFEAGFVHAGPVRAVAELVGTGPEVELGISVDSTLRRRGIGTELVETAAHLLAPRGVRAIRAYTLPGNRSFLSLAAACNAAVETGPDGVEVCFDVAPLHRSYLYHRAENAFRLGR